VSCSGFCGQNRRRLKKATRGSVWAIGVKRFFGFVWVSALLSVAPSACVYDASERCGPHQVLLGADRCACDEGYVPSTNGCVPCGEDERESNGECVCVDGFARPADGAACELIPAALGEDCGPDSAPCDPDYPLCHESEGTPSYCTNACQSDDDCTGGYKCHLDGADSYCRRPPLGYGDSCKTDDDCADGEATFCETIQSKLCLVPCAAGKTDGCFEGEVCCDFTLFNPICVPNDACTEKGGKELQ
jgi:hypothetical protein